MTVYPTSGVALSETAWNRVKQQVARLSLDRDRDVTLAMLSQANHRSPLSTVQVEHLLNIGYAAGRAKLLAENDRLRRGVESSLQELDRINKRIRELELTAGVGP